MTAEVGACQAPVGGARSVANTNGAVLPTIPLFAGEDVISVRVLPDRSVADFFVQGGRWSGTVAWPVKSMIDFRSIFVVFLLGSAARSRHRPLGGASRRSGSIPSEVGRNRMGENSKASIGRKLEGKNWAKTDHFERGLTSNS
jgi:hypothetical protein